MRFPVKGDIDKLTARYYQFGDTPYSIAGQAVVNPDGSNFGYRHHGSDIDVAVGTPTYAPEAGSILFSGNAGSAGNMIQVKGATGTHRMLHMERLVRHSGSVKQGELIGYSGATGFSNGIAHIHWDLAINGKYVDPLKYIKEEQVLTRKIAEHGSRLHFGRAASDYTIKTYVGKIGADEWLEKAENSDEAKARAKLLKKAKADLNNHLPSAAR